MMDIMRKVGNLCLVALVFILAACSQIAQNAQNHTPKKEAPKKEVQKAADDITGMLNEGPGVYAGKHYDQKKLYAELDRLPKNLSGEQVYDRLIYLLAEDYKPLVKKIDSFDPTLKVKEKTPDGLNGANGQQKKKTLNVEILLDSSGSMAGKVSGGVKMDLAKKAVQEFASKLPKEANVSLRVYGHRGTSNAKDKALSCRSNEVVYQLGKYNAAQFQQSLGKFKPAGWTPLAAAIEGAKQDLQNQIGEQVENIIYIVSDGVETCGGDPVQSAQSLHNSNIKAVINIIGFDVDDAGQQALKQTAEAGGGTYATVNSKEDLEAHFQQEYDRLKEEWSTWQTESHLQIYADETAKWEELNTVAGEGGEFSELVMQENANLSDALLYLSDKLDPDAYTYVDQKITDRYNQLDQYRQQRYDDLYTKLQEMEDKAHSEIDEKANQAQDQ